METTLELDSTILGVSVVAEGLNVPWDIVWGSDGHLWVTEQSGTVSRINVTTGEKKVLLNIKEVWRKRTSGLLGMALHPDLEQHPYVFVNYTTKVGPDSVIVSRLVRYTFQKDTLANAKLLLQIDGGTSHNGSRMAFTPDGKLLWATGDVQKKGYAQDSTVLNGKILRLNIDGSIPKDNPIPNSYVVAWGFRNMQGLAVAPSGMVYTSEHGEALEDEVNIIKPLQNYGWPEIEGRHDTPVEKAIAARHQRTQPLRSWTPTIAPAGIDFYASDSIPEWTNSILLSTLKGKSLRVLTLSHDGTIVTSEEVHLENQYGRLRDICVSPTGDIYVSTSNRDWNPSPGFPVERDDRILRIGKIKTEKRPIGYVRKPKPQQQDAVSGSALFTQHCAACHKEDGQGVPGTFPPLQGAEQVTGDKNQLAKIILKGLSGPITVKGQRYDQAMPSFGFLTDAEIASIATYVRSSWGNGASGISENEIKSNR
ncbi:PQQ-dependent sugar dehydrogenase [Rufibacter psychrotolerans]|uniref:PQQ-dependent sugar dehydrogenase n=1 Tax=Rufibacter psychrotolerans TaxID=2812556 RepID=UPI0019684B87|nr:PQQ-dependent sugar dehydrogenase [Rufibacter sp. SYSU D00308]